MKKILYICPFLFLCILVYQLSTIKDVHSYQTTNLEETLQAKGKNILFDDYQENSKQVPIYFFWRHNCVYCSQFLDYLNSITDKYGDYFRLISFETVLYPDNAELLKEVGKYLDYNIHSVPVIIIGDNVSIGYNSSRSEEYLNQILDEYKKTNQYDLFDQMKKEEYKKRTPYFIGFVLSILLLIVKVFVLQRKKDLKIEIIENKEL